MTDKTSASITSIETATTARWLSRALAPARYRSKEAPTAEAVDRIRARVFGETATKKADRSIAA